MVEVSPAKSLRWMSLDLTDDKSKLVQVMAWWRQETSHYLSQSWRRSMSPSGVTRQQWVGNVWTSIFWYLYSLFIVPFGVLQTDRHFTISTDTLTDAKGNIDTFLVRRQSIFFSKTTWCTWSLDARAQFTSIRLHNYAPMEYYMIQWTAYFLRSHHCRMLNLFLICSPCPAQIIYLSSQFDVYTYFPNWLCYQAKQPN